MVMLIKIPGPDSVVRDKAATISFRKPGTSTLRASFSIPRDEISIIKTTLETATSRERTYHIDLVDSQNIVCASFEKNVYIRRKDVKHENKVPER